MSRVDYCVNGVHHTELNGQDIDWEWDRPRGTRKQKYWTTSK